MMILLPKSVPMAGENENYSSNISSVLVLDDDEVARNLIANHFNRMGISDVVTFENANEALEAIKSRRFDFIVSDWKLQGMNGLTFFNRLRALPDYRNTPLMVVSGFVKKDDFRLLQEFPCTNLVEKPFTKVIFQKCVDSLVAESIWYGQNTTLVDAVLQAVKFDGKKAEQLIREIAKKAPNPVPLAVLAAKRLIKNDLLDPAKNILQMILEKDDRCVPALSELGKILHMQGEHLAALDFLRAASKLSPYNIKRLCLLGEVELNLNDPETARISFAKALVIDPDSEIAHAGMVVADNMDEFVPLASPTNVPRNFASLMNTMGITLVRNGQFSKGIEQYQSAMYFLENNEDNAKVAFNLGLGFLRWGKPKDALPWFRKSEQLVGDGQSKSAGYVQLLLKKLGVNSKLSSGKGLTIEGKVADYSNVASAAKQVKYVTDEEGENVDTTAFEQASLHLKGEGRNSQDEVAQSDDQIAEDAGAIGTLADINENELKEFDEAS